MDFGAADNGAMIATRAIHFAATAIVTGTLVFPAVVANPALKSQEAAAKLFRMQTRYVAWISLAATVISGLAWRRGLAGPSARRDRENCCIAWCHAGLRCSPPVFHAWHAQCGVPRTQRHRQCLDPGRLGSRPLCHRIRATADPETRHFRFDAGVRGR